jgi:xanthine phosphoribosyltransferase
MERRRRVVTWDEIHKLCDELMVNMSQPISRVVPVSRGGLAPAAIIAYQYRLEIVGVRGRGPRVDYNPTQDPELLIIDDVCDTGRTFRVLRRQFPIACLGALYAKPAGLATCDEWAEEVGQDVWVVLPWAPDDEINR